MNIHSIEQARIHGELLADFAQTSGARACFQSADSNPIAPPDELPKRISMFACIFAEEIMNARSCGAYAHRAWEIRTIKPGNYAAQYNEIRRLAKSENA